MARHFFILPSQRQGTNIQFSEIDERHFVSLRTSSRDILTCIEINPDNSDKTVYTVRIDKIGKHFLGTIQETKIIPLQYQKKIHILQCIPKLDKMDLIIQKTSELGVYELIPLFSRYTDVRNNIGENKLTRWQTISKESSIQSGRLDILYVQSPISLSSFLSEYEKTNHDQRVGLILNEKESVTSLHEIHETLIDKSITDIYLLIGAEGGFSDEEIQQATESSFISITLGKIILRTETTPIAMSAILQYILGVM